VSKEGKRRKRSRVSAKISKLRHEGERSDVAVATALNMERKHRLGPHGEYRRVGRKRTRKSRRRGRGRGYNRG